jgi:nucleotidyltransferase substrate binding protein (TIGR01987 family)
VSSERSLVAVRKLERALARLEEAVREPSVNPLAIDGTIQRFEFVFELSWKAMRNVLADQGIESVSPRSTIRAAYAARLIDDEPAWLALLQARNETTHTYDEERARRIYAVVVAAIPTLRAVVDRLRVEVDSSPE